MSRVSRITHLDAQARTLVAITDAITQGRVLTAKHVIDHGCTSPEATAFVCLRKARQYRENAKLNAETLEKARAAGHAQSVDILQRVVAEYITDAEWLEEQAQLACPGATL